MSGYKVFVSYSRVDKDIVAPIVQLMELTGSHKVFLDMKDIPAGAKWRLAVVASIEECRTFIVFWCKHSSGSKEVTSEILTARQSNKAVVPVILDGTRLSSDLADYQGIDLRPLLRSNHEEEEEVVHLKPLDIGSDALYREYSPSYNDPRTRIVRWRLPIPDISDLIGAGLFLKIQIYRLGNVLEE